MPIDPGRPVPPPCANGNTPTPDHATEIRKRYRALRTQLAPGTAVTLLHIGAEHTSVATGQDAEAQATLILAIGSRKTARDFFRRSPPTPLEMENAIATVEDEVTRAVGVLTAGSRLYCLDAVVREIALLSGVTPTAPMTLAIDAMEQTFERLAAVAEGRPALREGLPDRTDFAAALSILREFMHHLRFASITLP